MNLQFEKSNAAKRPLAQTEFFHIVLVLYAKSNNVMYPVLSKISAKIVVRGQNPGTSFFRIVFIIAEYIAGFYKDDNTISSMSILKLIY